jgi:hypothetical protein
MSPLRPRTVHHKEETMKNVHGTDIAAPTPKRKITLADLENIAGGTAQPRDFQVETKEDVKVVIR